ncbi:Hypothetical predicted protein [Marmota monax]|uniref:EF-hand domain-containing protein n=1 Tax=Marmota monax TaxID=9995 RepID=A0A5E4BTF2_MARMO|nr:Hypothetical predicted protein [Marmota monax]
MDEIQKPVLQAHSPSNDCESLHGCELCSALGCQRKAQEVEGKQTIAARLPTHLCIHTPTQSTGHSSEEDSYHGFCPRGPSKSGSQTHGGCFHLALCCPVIAVLVNRAGSGRHDIQGIEYEVNSNFTKSFHLIPGHYVVVPSAPREKTEYLLRIFLKMSDSDRISSNNFDLRELKGLDIDATQLQNLLNQELLTGDTFSLDECRSIVALMDLKVDGRLDQEEFGRLWKRLVHCQHVFQNIRMNSGVLLSSNLGKAIENTGIFVSSELLDLMTLRYSDSMGRVTFPSLVCFLMRLEAMAKTFRNLSKDGKGLYLTEMEVGGTSVRDSVEAAVGQVDHGLDLSYRQGKAGGECSVRDFENSGIFPSIGGTWCDGAHQPCSP